jgi:hypothetical protein
MSMPGPRAVRPDQPVDSLLARLALRAVAVMVAARREALSAPFNKGQPDE